MRIGIDPGVGGAIALLNQQNQFLAVQDMPVMIITGKRQTVNAAALSKILTAWVEGIKEPVICYLEQVSAMPGQGVSSMFSFGVSYGVVQGVLSALNIPFVLVTPQAWKKRAGLIHAEKDKARTTAQQLFPSADLSRKKDTGRADALLIARFGENKN